MTQCSVCGLDMAIATGYGCAISLKDCPSYKRVVETIDCTAHNITGMFLIEAIVQADKDHTKVKPGNPMVDVEFRINGHAFPFRTVLEDLWRRAVAELDQRAADKVAEALRGSKLDALYAILTTAEYELKQEVQKLFPNARFDE